MKLSRLSVGLTARLAGFENEKDTQRCSPSALSLPF
jgi:hypothetical protein